jgi:hypothetical protein
MEDGGWRTPHSALRTPHSAFRILQWGTPGYRDVAPPVLRLADLLRSNGFPQAGALSLSPANRFLQQAERRRRDISVELRSNSFPQAGALSLLLANRFLQQAERRRRDISVELVRFNTPEPR